MSDPGTPAYEAARARMVAELRRIGANNEGSGFAEMAEDLAAGDLMQVPTWVALQLLSKSESEAEIERLIEEGIANLRAFQAMQELKRRYPGDYACPDCGSLEHFECDERRATGKAQS